MAIMTGTAPALEAAQKGYLGGLTNLVKNLQIHLNLHLQYQENLIFQWLQSK